MAIDPVWVAISSVKSGLSANAALAEFRAAGGSIGRSSWLELYSQARANFDARSETMTQPLDHIPGGPDVRELSKGPSGGIFQQVEIYVREVGTTDVTVKPFTVFNPPNMLSHGDAIQYAIDTLSAHTGKNQYNEVILGGVYTGTYKLTGGPQ